MNKKFTKLMAALALLVFMTPSLVGWGQTRSTITINYDDTFNPTLPTASGSVNSSSTQHTDETASNFVFKEQGIYKGSGSDYLMFVQNKGFLYNTQSLGTITSVAVTYSSGTSTSAKAGVYFGSSEQSTYTTSSNATIKGQSQTDTWTNSTSGFGYFQFSTSNKNCQVTKIEITYTSAPPAYTINAQSNNTTYGTVSLSGSVITGSPNSGYRYASPAYTVSSGTATVSQSGNDFTVTPSSDCTVTINFEAIPAHTATFSVNGATTSQSFLEGAAIVFPSDPANISGKKFVGWVTETIAEPTDEEPSFVNTATETMGSSDVTYYAVFAIATPGDLVETKTQTLQYDSWTYSGSTTDKTTYRLFHTDSYIESAVYDLSKLSKVIVYGGTFGGDSYNSLTIGDGTNTWKNVTVTGKSETGVNTYTDGTALTGTKALRVTSNSGTASSTGVRISKVEIYTMEPSYTYSGYSTSVEVYTITAASNYDEYGTVSLSGEVITGSPKSGCRYASPAYTINPANSATVVQDGNEFTVTPLANTTITINFELIPTYTLSSAVSPVGAGTVALSVSSGLLEDATATATATANAGYKFTSWSISGDGASLSSNTDNPTTVTIGTANATVTANFEEVTTYAITYSVNGVTNTVNVEENTAVDFSAPNSALIPVGYVFKGWRTSAISTPTDTEPTDYVTSATSTADITYYAVMAKESSIPATETLTQSEITTNLTNTTCAYGTEKSFTDGSITWKISAYTDQASRPWMQLKKDASSYIKVEAPGKITELVFTITSATNSSGGITDITKHTAYSNYIYLESSPKSSPSGALGSTNTVSSNQMTIAPTGNNNAVYMQVASGARVWGVEVSYSTTTTTGFCTSISEVTLSEDVTIAGDLDVTSYTLTIPSGKTLTVSGTLTNNDPANLIIEDGGQLITDDVVEATIKKHITAWTTNPVGGWHFISYPLNCDYDGDAPTSVTNMIADPATNYDLYKLVDNTWANYKQNAGETNIESGFTLYTGHGYLYANANDVDLEFAGSLNYMNPDFTSLELGWNLVGNPYAYNAYPSLSYYKMNNDGTAISSTEYTTSDPVPPCTGILVQNDGTHTEITFSKTAPGEHSIGNHGNIEMTLAQQATNRGNATTLDNTIVSFNEGSQLGKFYFGTQNANLYIPQGNEEYAIVSSEGQGEMPVNFRANENGTYTLTVNAENVEMNYLHLIDNMTGANTDLLQTPSYTFDANTKDYESRFRLVFSAANGNEDDNEAPFAYFNGSEWMVYANANATLQVVDMMGRVIVSQSATNHISTNGMAQGVYVLRLLNGETVRTQKIVVR